MVVFPAAPEDVLESRFELAAYRPDKMPDPDPNCPEIAFAGRSNVGKSSLINVLIGRKNLARTSNTPGKTRALQVYRCRVRGRVAGGEAGSPAVEGGLRLVDLPGYGYAKVSKQERAEWAPLVEEYLCGRSVLWGVVVVIDGRRAPMDSDIRMAEWLGEAGIPFVAVLTKSDKPGRSERLNVLRGSEGPLRSCGARAVLQVSATEGTGVHDLWPALEEMGR